MNSASNGPSFFGRLQIAASGFFRILGDPVFAARVSRLRTEPERPLPAPAPAPVSAPSPAPAVAPAHPPAATAVVQKAVPAVVAPVPPERLHASGLAVLSMLQREGRLIDFLQEDIAGFPDADIGAAARAVHAGCKKVLEKCLTLEPVLREAEGGTVSVPSGFDANRIRLSGNVAGSGPFRGEVRHHGWVTSAVRFPTTSEALDPRVLAPAEVELP